MTLNMRPTNSPICPALPTQVSFTYTRFQSTEGHTQNNNNNNNNNNNFI